MRERRRTIIELRPIFLEPAACDLTLECPAVTVERISCPSDKPMAHQHSPRFLQIVLDAKRRVHEVSIDDVKGQLDRGEKLLLIDVREESEYAKDHLPGATHLGKGVIERDIEEHVPDLTTLMVLYCGGGYRSALTADNLQKMGYTNVLSMDGGVRGWREKGLPMSNRLRKKSE